MDEGTKVIVIFAGLGGAGMIILLIAFCIIVLPRILIQGGIEYFREAEEKRKTEKSEKGV